MTPELYSGPLSVFKTLHRNKFLFGAVIGGLLVTFPVVYIPTINQVVFKHHGLTWEWGVVFCCVVAYLSLVETWKAGKRRLLNRSTQTSIV
jgi:P-type Na+/K+ transporter